VLKKQAHVAGIAKVSGDGVRDFRNGCAQSTAPADISQAESFG